MKKLINISLIVLTGIIFLSCQTEREPEVKNIILLIGDGMSIAHVQAGILASEATLNMETSENIGLIHTYSASDFITDSGAAGTAIATGIKTTNGFIGMDPDQKPVKSILHIAAENGLATGLVVSCAVTHATPASFVAHQPDRNRVQDIAADFLNTDIDLFIGGGRDHFTRRGDQRDLVEELEQKGYFVAGSMEELNVISKGRVAGLFYPQQPPRYSAGRGDMLPESTAKALEILSNNADRFFLMIEGAQIDWGGHENSIDYIVEEVLDFDKTLGIVLEFAAKNGETLVIVTSDHDTGGLAIHGFDDETREVAARFTSGNHTGVLQPVFAWGPGAEKFRGIYDNTDIFKKMVELYRFGDN